MPRLEINTLKLFCVYRKFRRISIEIESKRILYRISLAAIMTFPGRKELPAFKELPLRKGDPPFSAWGLWENDQLGALNYLTDELVLKTAKDEIRTGLRVGLKYVLRLPQWRTLTLTLTVYLSISSLQLFLAGYHFRSTYITRHLGLSMMISLVLTRLR